MKIWEEVARGFEAKKMNYGLLGNQMPHIHWHLIPRLSNDPAPQEPAWRVPHDRVALSADQLQTTIGRIKKRL